MVNNIFCLSHFGEGCWRAASSPPSLPLPLKTSLEILYCQRPVTHSHLYDIEMAQQLLLHEYLFIWQKLLLFVFVFIIYNEKKFKKKKNSFN